MGNLFQMSNQTPLGEKEDEIIKRFFKFFFFNDTETPEIYTLSLHDALPIFGTLGGTEAILIAAVATCVVFLAVTRHWRRSEEYTSELQSRRDLVCRLLL